MGLLDGIETSGFFAISAQQDTQNQGVAQRSLLSALDLYKGKRYDEAIAKFNQAVSIAPRSEVAINAYEYMARSYLGKGDTASAIATYKKSLQIDPQRPETLISLGNAYITANQPKNAVEQYQKLVAQDPSAVNRYYLGQSYLLSGQYGDAEQQFKRIIELESDAPNGYVALGQAYAKQGRSDEAVSAFEHAISLKYDYWEAHSELGYALADVGEFDKAGDIANRLTNQSDMNAIELGAVLTAYINKKTPPQMIAAYSTGTFLQTLGPGTAVSTLGSNLASANSQQTLTMVFQFNETMDVSSVENVLNWTISRSISTGKADGYNFDWAVPSTEAELASTPIAVSYDREKKTATVYFNVFQNATANGTIDPSHIKFTFSGTNADGMTMDSAANEYSGFSGFA